MISRRILDTSRFIVYVSKRKAGTAKAASRYAVENKKDLMTTVLDNRTINSAEEWIQVRKEILEAKSNINCHNIDAMMLGFYTNSQNYSMAVKFVDFLKSQHQKLNLATTGKYFRLFYLLNNKKEVTEIDEKELIRMYEDIRKLHPVLDSITLDHVIEGLSITSRWRTCLDLFKEVKLTATPTTATYNSVVSTLFRNGEEDLGWEILQEMIENGRDPKASTFISYLNYIDRYFKRRKQIVIMIEKLFLFLQDSDIICDSEFTSHLMNFLKSHGFTAGCTNIGSRGHCVLCKKNVNKFDISTNEFNILKKSIIENVIIGRDVFNKSTPDELQKFTDFIGRGKTYDVVIDGLNVAYSVGTKQNLKVRCTLLSAVVRHFLTQNKKVLLLGREHMKKWSGFKHVTQDIDVFLTSDASHDDPYLLYCALHSGKDTIIVSRDLMRGHKFLLKDYKLKMVFNRWLSQRLYQLKFVDKNGKAIFMVPSQFTISTQKVENYWHIPYSIKDCISLNSNTKELDILWLCIQL